MPSSIRRWCRTASRRASPHAVALHRSAQSLGDGKSDAHTTISRHAQLLGCPGLVRLGNSFSLGPQIKYGHVPGKVAPPLLIHPLKIRVLQQMRGFRETAFRCVAHAVIHGVRVPDSSLSAFCSQRRHRSARLLRRNGCFSVGERARNGRGLRWLIAVSGANRDALTSLGAPARQYGLAAFGLHALPKPVHFGTVAAIGLECPFRHLTDCSCFKKCR